jgi:SPP1 gp7 family putative phage head morphogenesis protein
MEKELDKLEEEITEELHKINTKRLNWILENIDEIVEKVKKNADFQLPFTKEIMEALKKHLIKTLKAGIKRGKYEIDLLKERLNIKVKEEDKGVIPEKTLKDIDKYILKLTQIYDKSVVDRIREVIKRGIEEGLSTRELAKKVKEAGGKWITSDSHAETIARTETTRYYTAGKLRRFFEEKDFVKALQYNAIRDTRTTSICKQLDGLTIPIENKSLIIRYSPPNHFNCRSSWSPITEFEQWNDDSEKMKKVKLPKGFDGEYK